MISCFRCSSNSADFIYLTGLLDKDLENRNGKSQAEYTKYNLIDDISTVVVAKNNGTAIACGCFKVYGKDSVEIKRMYVRPEFRGRGISKEILSELEKWAKELGFSKSLLETGIKQKEAIGLYETSGYRRTENYGQYIGMKNSVCFIKEL